MHAKRLRESGALALFAAALAWPSVYGALIQLMLSPAERVLRAAWCGAASHQGDAFLGHCAACWAGAALLATSAALMQLASHPITGVEP